MKASTDTIYCRFIGRIKSWNDRMERAGFESEAGW